MKSLCFIKKCTSLLKPVKDAVRCNIQPACRSLYTVPNEALEKQRTSPLNTNCEQVEKRSRTLKQCEISEYRDRLPEFLPTHVLEHRDRISELLERKDMLRRRKIIEIPEFYVGSVLAVTVADKYAPGKSSRFVGICIDRSELGLRHNFTLRNVVDDQGVEIMYDMYNPLLISIQVLRLEKRLDDTLLYLRDCPLEYSYFPQDMKGQMIHKGVQIPVNETKVKLGPRPWSQRWDRYDLKGVEEFTDWKNEKVKLKAMKSRNHPQVKKLWDKSDIVKHYRESINPEEAADVYEEVKASKESWKKKDL